MGPAMAALKKRQRGFVDAMFTVGISRAKAARVAGYAEADFLMRNPKVVAAIREEALRRYGPLLPACHKALETIVRDPESKDHFAAIKHTQAITGVVPTDKTEVVVETASLKAELTAAIELLQSVAGERLEHSDGP
jgi:hypothetical protein